ncbi:hypothetical protein HYH03_008222 [Edaphochlamys debaryana]|uniref:peptidylprolyl isomerase n=1 Tax=Edaphochlamys debaryana TaxID=47281 RepID=A0A836BZS4_9CHLO|nr:hypothetical protein HYH03_008222 [Edaphochlamys debaryana]|eukprot:KAG2493708.1 hypothetical protein HYH03_008222 [Edaphochlamys debaryana]
MTQADLANYLAELRLLPPEVPLEPELKPQRLKLDKRIREEQALAGGAVLSAVLEDGDGKGSPAEGDLVYIQYSIRDLEDELLYTTRSEEGGSGQAFAFLMEKGVRVPRGWEVAIKAMSKGQRSVLQVKPGFGFAHPDCAMQPPVRDLKVDSPLRYDVTLVNWYPADTVHQYGTAEELYKRAVREGAGWESPRPPFEVTLHLTVCCPAYDGLQLTGQRLYSSRGRQPLSVQMGRGLLPPGVEEALSFMSRGEVATFVLPARSVGGRGGGAGAGAEEEEQSSGEDGDLLSPASAAGARAKGGRGGGAGAAQCLVPPPPDRCVQVEVEAELISMVQVRDMTGTGEVTKKRIREGTGEFPIDCPLNDTTVTLHFRARPLAAGGSGTEVEAGTGEDAGGPWLYDSRAEGAEPLTADTGCGELPEGLEMGIKLMVPGEVSRVVAAPRYAYAGRSDCPPALARAAAATAEAAEAAADPLGGAEGRGEREFTGEELEAAAEGLTVEWEVELLDFQREGHWQNLSFEERYEVADRLKSKGNELYKRGQHKFARARYERLLRLLDSTRDFETEEQVARVDAYKVAALGNMALACMQAGDFAAAAATCDKGLEFEPDNAKLHFRKGKALSLKGDYEEAAEALQLALEHDPDSEKSIRAELSANTERQKAAARAASGAPLRGQPGDSSLGTAAAWGLGTGDSSSLGPEHAARARPLRGGSAAPSAVKTGISHSVAKGPQSRRRRLDFSEAALLRSSSSSSSASSSSSESELSYSSGSTGALAGLAEASLDSWQLRGRAAGGPDGARHGLLGQALGPHLHGPDGRGGHPRRATGADHRSPSADSQRGRSKHSSNPSRPKGPHAHGHLEGRPHPHQSQPHPQSSHHGAHARDPYGGTASYDQHLGVHAGLPAQSHSHSLEQRQPHDAPANPRRPGSPLGPKASASQPPPQQHSQWAAQTAPVAQPGPPSGPWQGHRAGANAQQRQLPSWAQQALYRGPQRDEAWATAAAPHAPGPGPAYAAGRSGYEPVPEGPGVDSFSAWHQKAGPGAVGQLVTGGPPPPVLSSSDGSLEGGAIPAVRPGPAPGWQPWYNNPSYDEYGTDLGAPPPDWPGNQPPGGRGGGSIPRPPPPSPLDARPEHGAHPGPARGPPVVPRLPLEKLPGYQGREAVPAPVAGPLVAEALAQEPAPVGLAGSGRAGAEEQAGPWAEEAARRVRALWEGAGLAGEQMGPELQRLFVLQWAQERARLAARPGSTSPPTSAPQHSLDRGRERSPQAPAAQAPEADFDSLRHQLEQQQEELRQQLVQQAQRQHGAAAAWRAPASPSASSAGSEEAWSPAMRRAAAAADAAAAAVSAASRALGGVAAAAATRSPSSGGRGGGARDAAGSPTQHARSPLAAVAGPAYADERVAAASAFTAQPAPAPAPPPTASSTRTTSPPQRTDSPAGSAGPGMASPSAPSNPTATATGTPAGAAAAIAGVVSREPHLVGSHHAAHPHPGSPVGSSATFPSSPSGSQRGSGSGEVAGAGVEVDAVQPGAGAARPGEQQLGALGWQGWDGFPATVRLEGAQGPTAAGSVEQRVLWLAAAAQALLAAGRDAETAAGGLSTQGWPRRDSGRGTRGGDISFGGFGGVPDRASDGAGGASGGGGAGSGGAGSGGGGSGLHSEDRAGGASRAQRISSVVAVPAGLGPPEGRVSGAQASPPQSQQPSPLLPPGFLLPDTQPLQPTSFPPIPPNATLATSTVPSAPTSTTSPPPLPQASSSPPYVHTQPAPALPETGSGSPLRGFGSRSLPPTLHTLSTLSSLGSYGEYDVDRLDELLRAVASVASAAAAADAAGASRRSTAEAPIPPLVALPLEAISRDCSTPTRAELEGRQLELLSAAGSGSSREGSRSGSRAGSRGGSPSKDEVTAPERRPGGAQPGPRPSLSAGDGARQGASRPPPLAPGASTSPRGGAVSPPSVSASPSGRASFSRLPSPPISPRDGRGSVSGTERNSRTAGSRASALSSGRSTPQEQSPWGSPRVSTAGSTGTSRIPPPPGLPQPPRPGRSKSVRERSTSPPPGEEGQGRSESGGAAGIDGGGGGGGGGVGRRRSSGSPGPASARAGHSDPGAASPRPGPAATTAGAPCPTSTTEPGARLGGSPAAAARAAAVAAVTALWADAARTIGPAAAAVAALGVEAPSLDLLLNASSGSGGSLSSLGLWAGGGGGASGRWLDPGLSASMGSVGWARLREDADAAVLALLCGFGDGTGSGAAGEAALEGSGEVSGRTSGAGGQTGQAGFGRGFSGGGASSGDEGTGVTPPVKPWPAEAATEEPATPPPPPGPAPGGGESNPFLAPGGFGDTPVSPLFPGGGSPSGWLTSPELCLSPSPAEQHLFATAEPPWPPAEGDAPVGGFRAVSGGGAADPDDGAGRGVSTVGFHPAGAASAGGGGFGFGFGSPADTFPVGADADVSADAADRFLLSSQVSLARTSRSLGFSAFGSPDPLRASGRAAADAIDAAADAGESDSTPTRPTNSAAAAAGGAWEGKPTPRSPEADWRGAADSLGLTPYQLLYEFKGALAGGGGDSRTSTPLRASPLAADSWAAGAGLGAGWEREGGAHTPGSLGGRHRGSPHRNHRSPHRRPGSPSASPSATTPVGRARSAAAAIAARVTRGWFAQGGGGGAGFSPASTSAAQSPLPARSPAHSMLAASPGPSPGGPGASPGAAGSALRTVAAALGDSAARRADGHARRAAALSELSPSAMGLWDDPGGSPPVEGEQGGAGGVEAEVERRQGGGGGAGGAGKRVRSFVEGEEGRRGRLFVADSDSDG